MRDAKPSLTAHRVAMHRADHQLLDDLTFAPVDFETQTLKEGLTAAGDDPDKRTFFSWPGVTGYFSEESVMATFGFIAETPAGSAVVFDYILSPSLLTPSQGAGRDRLSHRVALAGEPWQTCFDPEVLAGDLRGMGFSYVKDNIPEDINERYLKIPKTGFASGACPV